MSDAVSPPADVIWDVTYACPLRCVHCYSESGRRPARRLSHGDMLRVADAIVSLGPRTVEIAGGEPLLVKGIYEVAERISRAGIDVNLYTSGWTFTRRTAEECARAFRRIIVSVDGADAAVHDRVRGRAGSFERAMNTLALLDGVAATRAARGEPPLDFGIDCSVMRANLHQVELLCSTVAARFPHLRFVNLAAAVPSGLASRAGFGEHELLTDDDLDWLVGEDLGRRLRAVAPPSVQVSTTDNFVLLMRPDVIARFGFSLLQVEPDGEVRAMPIYEGCVGNLLSEDPMVLWRRAVERWSDPFVVETLAPVTSMAQWADAVRRIDRRFGSDEVRLRIDRRDPWPGGTG